MAMLAVWLRGGWPSIEQRKLHVVSVAERHAMVAMITRTTEDLTAEDPRRRSGFMRLPAYPCSESPGVLPRCACVLAWLCYTTPCVHVRGCIFIIPGLNIPGWPLKNRKIDHYLCSQNTPRSHRRFNIDLLEDL